MGKHFSLMLGALLLLSLGPVRVSAQDANTSPPAASTQEARDAEAKAAWEAAMSAAVKGPAEVPFKAQAVLKLPIGYMFVPAKDSDRLLRAWGNSGGGDGFVGLVTPGAPDEDWFITADFVDAGYVKDEEAKNWDTEALLKSSRDGVEAENADRAARGFPKIQVDGWIEKPTYDATQHRLIYSTALSAIGAKPEDERSVNFHTYALGREGYFALDLVTGSNSIGRFKDRAKTVLGALDYNPGKRYEQFVAGTDRIAEYGIAALVAGVAAKQLGLLALAGLALAKFGGALVAFAKPIGIGAVALVAGVGRFFRRRK